MSINLKFSFLLTFMVTVAIALVEENLNHSVKENLDFSSEFPRRLNFRHIVPTYIQGQSKSLEEYQPSIEMKDDDFVSSEQNWNSFYRTSNIIITLRNPLDNILQRLNSQFFPNRQSKLKALTDALKRATATIHSPIIAALRVYNARIQSFWVTNQIMVSNVNPNTINILKRLNTVIGIAQEIVFPIAPGLNPANGFAPNGNMWHVRKIGADEMWRHAAGNGVVVGIIDTGVRATHIALRNNFVGVNNNGWFDPISGSTFPSDSSGHGTHCAGVVCGNNGIGVAPMAKFMACKGCDSRGCPQSALISCGQWILCPTDPQGNNADCSKAPHVVSNSWGHTGGQTWFQDVIKAWNAGGIIGVFAVGNNGPNCGTADSPADNVGTISVGSTGINDTVSNFSGKGPKQNQNGGVIPLVVAPGEDINSAYHYSDTAYQILSGTSMATPTVAGAVAIILSANRQLNLNQVSQLLSYFAFRRLGSTGYQCGRTSENFYPNDVSGYGRLDIKQSLLGLARAVANAKSGRG